ncbi:MAG: SpoIIE family protein phosphatase [Solirubrobacteraceae bacterium]
MSAIEPPDVVRPGETPAGLDWVEAVLDLVPLPLLLVEPGSGGVTFANTAAHRLAGGAFPMGVAVPEGEHWTDAEGSHLSLYRLPCVRAGRGEQLVDLEVRWHRRDGELVLLASSGTLPAFLGRPEAVVVAFEDITEIRAAQEVAIRHAEQQERLYEEARAAQVRAVEALALLDTLFATAPVGLAYFDRELRYVRLNDALAEINGLPAREHLGRTVPEVLPDMDPEVVEAFRRVLETGEPILDMDMTGETPKAPGTVRHWLGSFYPVRPAEGEVIGVGAVVVETTERQRGEDERERALAAERTERKRAERAERRARLLADAGAALNESLDYEGTVRRLATLVVPARADWCVVDMLEVDGSIERVVVAHGDPAKERAGWELSRRYPASIDDPAGVARVLRTGLPELHREISSELLEAGARDHEHLGLLRDLGLRSLMTVPVRRRGRVLGAISFVNDEHGPLFDQDDLELAVDLADRAAVAIENARLYTSRSDIARTLQQSLLPPHLPAIAGLELAARYRAAGEDNEVGGDFYDVFATSERHWALVIGDVCGKGAEAAALTALMRYTLRAAAMDEEDPSAILAQLNQAILSQRSDGRFSTALFARIELEDGGAKLCMASGGHPLPVLVRAGGAAEVVGAAGTLLGVLPDVRHVDCRVWLGPGDALVLFTDGLTEAGAPERVMCPEELVELGASCAGLPADEIARRVEEHAVALQDGLARDDLALLVARVAPRT